MWAEKNLEENTDGRKMYLAKKRTCEGEGNKKKKRIGIMSVEGVEEKLGFTMIKRVHWVKLGVSNAAGGKGVQTVMLWTTFALEVTREDNPNLKRPPAPISNWEE